ncbi:putative butyrophilin subfamily 2 member A3 [Poecilia formosa]|uniref:putative butyrophilin subfamily 2 member A3 n=1 Tax=Poecilia formosa TaxID=48698 RepID=UPI000443B1BA|nr:PREDICTED: putative butyrophilin subfamily 2 member A3 [Poecilia formosa]
MSFLRVFLSLLLSAVYPATHGQQQVKVKLGQNICLECVGPSDEEIKLFTWTKDGLGSDHVFFYRNGRSYGSYQHESFRGRVDLRSSLKDGDFSVVLHNVSKTDGGTYRCVIITRRSGGHDGKLHSFVNLTVSGEDPAGDPSGTDEEQNQDDEDEAGRTGDLANENDSLPLVIIVVSVIGLLILIIIIIGCFLRKSAGLLKYRLGHSEHQSKDQQVI